MEASQMGNPQASITIAVLGWLGLLIVFVGITGRTATLAGILFTPHDLLADTAASGGGGAGGGF